MVYFHCSVRFLATLLRMPTQIGIMLCPFSFYNTRQLLSVTPRGHCFNLNVWRPGLQRGLSMPGNPPTVLRHFTTLRGKDQRTVDYVGNRKVRMNFLNRFYVDLTSILLTVIFLAALWFFCSICSRIGLVLD